jgi:signal transduction histidine kinase
LIKVALRKKRGVLELQVRENGGSIPEEKVSQSLSLSLLGIRERLQVYGGAVSLQRLPGQETVFIIRTPTQRKASLI